MTDYTSILHLPLVAGNQDQKEATINTAIAILEAAMNDSVAVDLTGTGDYVLTQDQFTKYFFLRFNNQGAARNVVVPATQRWFAVENLGAYSITFKAVGSTGLTAELPSGKIGLLVTDGTDVRWVSPDPTSGMGLLQDLSDVAGVPADKQLLRYDAPSHTWGPWSFSIKWDDLTDAPNYLFTGNNGMLLAVNAAGNGLEWVTNAANVHTFTDLSDTPSNFTGAANRTVKVNSAATGLIFAFPKLTEATDFPASYTGQAGKFARVNPGQTAMIFDMPKVVDLTDGPGAPAFAQALYYLRVNAAGTGLEYALGTGGPDHFYQLLDVPSSYTGAGLKLVRVNVDENALIYDDFGFNELKDTPSNYTGAANKFVRVNSLATGLLYGGVSVQDLSNGPGPFTSAAKKVVRVNAASNALEYVALALTDLTGFPTAFTGQGGKYLQVKADESGVQFSSSSFTTSFVALTDTPTSYTGKAGQQVVVNSTANGLTFAPQPFIPHTLDQLADVELGTGIPHQGAYLRYMDGIWQADYYDLPSGAGTFLGLFDTPAAYTGAGLQLVRVNAAGTALEFTAAPFVPHRLGQLDDVEDGTGTPVENALLTWKNGVWQAEPPASAVTTFLGLTDTPSAYTGAGLQLVRVNAAGTALEFSAAPFIPYTLGQLADVEDGTGTPVENSLLTWKNGVWQAEPPAGVPVTALSGLSDVDESTAPSNGQVLTFNTTAGKWKPAAPASGSGGSTTLAGLTDVDVTTTAPTNGQALLWNTTHNNWEPGTVAALGGSGGGSTGVAPTHRGTTPSGVITTATVSLALPAGSVAGDFLVFMGAGGNFGYPTSSANGNSGGWTKVLQHGTYWGVEVFFRTLTSTDISTGSIGVTVSGTSFANYCTISVFAAGAYLASVGYTAFNPNTTTQFSPGNVALSPSVGDVSANPNVFWIAQASGRGITTAQTISPGTLVGAQYTHANGSHSTYTYSSFPTGTLPIFTVTHNLSAMSLGDCCLGILATGGSGSAGNSTTFGSGAPTTLHNNGDVYFDTSVTPYAGYVQNAGVWEAFGASGLTFDVALYVEAAPTASERLLRVPISRASTFAANFSGSFANASTAATASTVFDVRKNGTSVGSITFAAAATTATFTTTGGTAVSFAAGDYLEIIAPNTPDATLKEIGFSLKGVRT